MYDITNLNYHLQLLYIFIIINALQFFLYQVLNKTLFFQKINQYINLFHLKQLNFLN